MIEKLNLNDSRHSVIIEKINEIIEAVNKMDTHTHDVHVDVTTEPRYGPVSYDSV